MITGLHSNLNEVRIDNRKYGTVLQKLVMKGYKLVRAQQPVERARLGFVPMSSPDVTAMHQGQEGKFAPGQKIAFCKKAPRWGKENK